MSNSASTAELLFRLIFSMGIVLGVLWIGARAVRKRGLLAGRDQLVEVLDRRPLGAKSSVMVLRIGARTVALAATDKGTALLAEGDDLATRPAAPIVEHTELDDLVPTPSARRTSPRGRTAVILPGAEPADDDPTAPTRMNFIDALREMTVRRT